jgi:superfamily II DNA or RNA helicase
MNAPTLYPFQHDVLRKLDAAIAAGQRRILLVCPTGGGKTIVAAEYIRRETENKRRVLFLAHRREMTRQAAAKLYKLGVTSGIIQAGFPARPSESVQVASIATLHARAIRTTSINLPEADIVIVDEAHHAPARSWQKILARYPNAIILGMTATPCRGDGRGLGAIFDVMIEAPSVADLIAGGYLVPTRVYAPTKPDLKGVRVKMGDYVESQLAERMDQPKLTGDIVSHWLQIAQRKRTVLFATGVAHSVHIRDEFRRAGVLAEHIDGQTPVEERDAILAQLDRGEIEIVCNAMVLTEGWDCPAVSCLVLARPTKSLGLYRQMAGRVLRPAPGKDHALILDHAGATFEHGFAEDEIAWTLDEDTKAANPTHARRGSSPTMPRLRECPECMAVMFEGRGCAVCGWKPRPKPQSFDVREGVLGEVGHDRKAHAKAEDRRDFLAQLKWIARERNYRDGWISHKYRQRFGAWPQWRDVTPKAPTDATRSWVRSRQIAFAKAQEKARDAV